MSVRHLQGIGSGIATDILGPEVFPQLAFHGVCRRPRQLLSCEVLRAVDRPDRLCVEFLDQEPYFVVGDGVDSTGTSVRGEDFLPPPGTPVSLLIADCCLAEGRTESLVFGHDVDGPPSISLIASAAYHARRSRVNPREFRSWTLSEIVRRLAVDLGLEARIDMPDLTIPCFQLSGDPLRDLRELARRCSVGIAVVGDKLVAVRELPSSPREYVLGVSLLSRLLALRVHLCLAGGGSRRLLEISLPGASIAEPLDRILLEGFGSRPDGRYRLVRSRTRLDSSGWSSHLLLSEEGPASICLDLPEGGEVQP